MSRRREEQRMIEVEIFWTENAVPSEQKIQLPQIPRQGDLLKTRSGYLGSVAMVKWLLDGDPVVHVVLT